MSETKVIQEGNLFDLLEEEKVPMKMTFRPASSDTDSDSDSDGVEEMEVKEEDDDEEKVDANAGDKADTVETKVEDEDAKTLQNQINEVLNSNQ